MKFISLFAGIGGFDLALIRQGHECVWANEWDKYAAQIYDKNFKSGKSLQRAERGTIQSAGIESDTKVRGNSQSKTWGNREFKQPQNSNGIDTRDIRTVPTEEIPDHDLLVGGFPCQSFSIAGKRRGFSDTRGTLFFEIARILREKYTRLFILENVKGLLSHDNGNTFKTIISTLVELGYDLQWQVLNSKNFGVPQNRERVFIIGNLRGTSRPEVFPIRNNDEVYNQSNENKEEIHNIASTMTARQFSSWNGNYIDVIGSLEGGGWEKRNESTRRIYGISGISPTIPTAQGGGVMAKIMVDKPFVALTERRTEEAKRLRRLGIVKDTRNLKKLEPREDGIANTVTTGDVKNSSLTNGSKIRRLTPIECERLQGFPDNWTAGVSDTQRYKMCGNAVTVNVVSYLVSKL